jgi:metallo-beta-lactamase class B
MSRNYGLLAATVTLLLAGASQASSAPSPAAYNSPPTTLPASVQHHIDLAYLLLNGEVSRRYMPALLSVIDGAAFGNPMQQVQSLAPLPAVKAFDQFYYLGTPVVTAWALNTSDGIILFDTLDNEGEAKTYIEEGLKHVGLDPTRIKYIVVSHGHSDHYGGAKYLAEKYHAHVLMSPADWAFAAAAASRPAQPGRPATVPAPVHDIEVVDGQTLTLGKTTIRLYITPGHTPGTVSAIFPVTDHGRPHTVSFLGGAGIGKNAAQGAYKTLRDSMERFAKVSIDAHADVVISCHGFMDDSWEKAKAVLDGKVGSVNPWVVGSDAVLRYYAATVEAVEAIETYSALNPPKQ